jgi:hypothetical protein
VAVPALPDDCRLAKLFPRKPGIRRALLEESLPVFDGFGAYYRIPERRG